MINMNENEWTKSICELLQNKLGDNIYIDVFRKIPYALEKVVLPNPFSM